MRLSLLVLPVLLVAPLLGPAGPAGAVDPVDAPPPQAFDVTSLLPPGNSGFVSVAGQAAGTLSGEPEDFGPHVDDQRELYWTGGRKPGAFLDTAGLEPERPADGVRLYHDPAGVPVVHGDTGYDVWFGAGYAAGQQRLFLADAVRRMGRGTFAELTGPTGVPLDVQTRTLTYSDAEYAAMLAALPASSREAVEGYAAGLDAWIDHVRVTPADLPAEYVLLQTLPEPWTVTDTLAAGVLITRTVASSGGTELTEVQALRDLRSALGDEPGLGAFQDLRWQQDELATTTVPEEEGRFDNAVVPAAQRDQVLRESAAYALGLPPELATGPGTGAAAEPGPPGLPAAPALPAQVRSSLTTAVDGLLTWASGLHGGSYAFAVAPERTTTGEAMLVSGPQLGYSYPSLLWELEVHGGGYDARGATVPGLPTIGIGYGERVAWGLTTGYSKTIDSFVETTRRTAGRLEYLHQGTWKPASCRTETIRYRAGAMGVPTGPPAFSQDVEVCRTVHGPVVAEVGDQARSVQYAMFGRELETVNGILAWNRADDLAEFEAGVRQVTWNENVTYADADGRIAFWHPGLYPVRSASWDSRFPAPGTGEHDRRGFVPFEQMPHSVDPAVGYLANWNTKPAVGWIDEFLDPASGRPSGRSTRAQVILDLLASRPRLSPADLTATEFRLGTVEQRVDLLRLLRELAPADDRQRAALSLVQAWDGTAYGPGAGTSTADIADESATDGPAPTLFRRFADVLRDEVLTDLPDDLVVAEDTVGSHVFDATPADNLVLRVLDPAASSLTPSRDYLDGRSAQDALRAALDTTLDALVADFGADPAAWRDLHPRSAVDSLTGVIGPSTTTPYEDRGSWIHVVAFRPDGVEAVPAPTAPGAPTAPTAPPTLPGPPAQPVASGPSLAATGPRSSGLVALGLLLVAGLVGRRRLVRGGPSAQ